MKDKLKMELTKKQLKLIKKHSKLSNEITDYFEENIYSKSALTFELFWDNTLKQYRKNEGFQ